MWKISSTENVYVVGIGETFEGLSDEEKKIAYESANYMKKKVELELAKRVGEICRLADSLTAEEWLALPPRVGDFLFQYKEVEEDDDE